MCQIKSKFSLLVEESKLLVSTRQNGNDSPIFNTPKKLGEDLQPIPVPLSIMEIKTATWILLCWLHYLQILVSISLEMGMTISMKLLMKRDSILSQWSQSLLLEQLSLESTTLQKESRNFKKPLKKDYIYVYCRVIKNDSDPRSLLVIDSKYYDRTVYFEGDIVT